MKRILLLLLTVILVMEVYAQGKANAAENEALKVANAAMQAYKTASKSDKQSRAGEAFNKLETYLKVNNFKNNSYIYNTALIAMQAKKYPEAITYLDMCIKNKYKVGASYAKKADIYEDQNKIADAFTALDIALKTALEDKNNKLVQAVEKSYLNLAIKEGNRFQKAGNEEKAEEMYLKATVLNNKECKVIGYVSLAKMYYNNGAKILEAAGNDRTKYEEEKGKAMNDFKKAKEYVIKAKQLDAQNTEATELLSQINAEIK